MINEKNKHENRGRRLADRELEVQYELMKIIAEQNQELMFEYDVNSDYGALYEIRNGQLEEKISYEDFLVNMDEEKYKKAIHPEDRGLFKKTVLKSLKRPSQFVLDIKCCFSDNEDYRWYRLFLASVDDLRGKVTTLAGRFLSIDAEKNVEESIKHKAEIDALTGVYNHITFESKCEKMLELAEDDQMILLMLDVDDFKSINDNLGHNVGDMVLGQTGKILKSYLKDRGFAGRLGGDEFALLAWHFDSREEIEDFCNKLRAELKTIIFDMEYSASMGVSILDGRKLTFKDLYYEADQAVYASKKKGKNQINYYDMVKEEELSSAGTVNNRNIDSTKGNTDFDLFVLDEKIEYIFIVDKKINKIIQTNKPLRDNIIDGSEDLVGMECFEIAKSCSMKCKNCEKLGEQYFVSKSADRELKTLDRIFGPHDFLIGIMPIVWKNRDCEQVALIDLDNPKQVDAILKKQYRVTGTINQCIRYIGKEDINGDHNSCLHWISDFYDADCVALVKYNDGRFDELEEIHKPNSLMMAKVITSVVEKGKLTKYHSLVDEEGRLFLHNVSSISDTYPALYKDFVDSRVWSVIAKRIGRFSEIAGVIILLNPRQNTAITNVLDAMGIFLAGDMLRYEMEKSQNYIKTHDRLTGLLRRSTLLDRSKWDNYEAESLGVFVTDILGLAEINKEFGYITGDERVCQVAEIIKSVFAGFKLLRYDDDEMLAVCFNVDMTAFQNMVQWAREMIGDLDFPVSMGYSWSLEVNLRKQIDEAEGMLKLNKEEFKNNNNLSELADTKVRNDVLEQLKNGNFITYLQPKMNIEKNKVVGAEALVRLDDPEKGIIAPTYFISILEHHDVVHLVDLYVLEDVCRYQRYMLDKGKEAVPISVNFSKRTLMYSELLDKVREIMDKFALPKGLVQIEITETVGDMDQIALSTVANSLRTMGFELAMDDFGTKYSNLEMLVKFQFSVAKIDRSLIKGIVGDEKNCIVLRHLIQMIAELGIDCVVEGVEEQSQVDILREMNCKVIQGYFFGKPIPIEDFYDTFIKKDK